MHAPFLAEKRTRSTRRLASLYIGRPTQLPLSSHFTPPAPSLFGMPSFFPVRSPPSGRRTSQGARADSEAAFGAKLRKEEAAREVNSPFARYCALRETTEHHRPRMNVLSVSVRSSGFAQRTIGRKQCTCEDGNKYAEECRWWSPGKRDKCSGLAKLPYCGGKMQALSASLS